jgi:hypothetical protein
MFKFVKISDLSAVSLEQPGQWTTDESQESDMTTKTFWETF